MDFLKKHSSKLAVSFGAAALLVGGYMIYKQNQAVLIKPNGQEVIITANQSVVFVKDDKYLTAIEKFKPQIAAELAGSGLSKQAIIQINQLVVYVFKEDYLRIFTEGRRVRRKVIDNADVYVKEFIKYSTEAEKLMENASLEVLRDLGVSMDEYEKCCENIIQADPQFAMYNLMIFESIKLELAHKHNKPVTKELLAKVFQCQIDNVQTTIFDSLDILPQYALALRQTYASDRSASQFGIEDEDILLHQALLQDPEIMVLHKELQEIILGSQDDNYGY